MILSCRRLSPVGQKWTDVDTRGHGVAGLPALNSEELEMGEVVEPMPIDDALAAGGSTFR
jgi:hypothetical protein